MRLVSLVIKEGIFEKKIDFSNKINLIFSERNSVGKTTLLRLMLYALGFQIPNTRGMLFGKCSVRAVINTEKYGNVILLREERKSISVETSDKIQTFILPDQQQEVQHIIFGTYNVNILNNILGCFYIDQEKGWTLLNRGVVIGGIRFNIEELIRGLSGKDCEDLLKKQETLKSKQKKYKDIFSVAMYRNKIIEQTGSMCQSQYDESAQTTINQLLIRQSNLKKELQRIDQILKNNGLFRKFITDIKLLVQDRTGNIIPVTSDNIVGLQDSIDLLVTKKRMLTNELNDISQQISNIEEEREKEQRQMEFFASESMIDIFDRKIAAIPMNPFAINEEIKKIDKELVDIKRRISIETKKDNNIAESLYNTVVKYATELGVGDSDSIAKTYLYTSNLKEMSGAVLHKTVFAFKMAYIIEVEKVLGIKLPIILDSPSGKEVDPQNVQLMINILKRDFVDNQIIIASIFRYDFKEIALIKLQDRLMEA